MPFDVAMSEIRGLTDTMAEIRGQIQTLNALCHPDMVNHYNNRVRVLEEQLTNLTKFVDKLALIISKKKKKATLSKDNE